MSITDFLRSSRRFPGLRAISEGFWPGALLTAAFHLIALVRIFQTETSLFAIGLALLIWGFLNCLWLLLLRRPAIAAFLSLGMVELLILVSQFKFKITWMTATFLDIMVIDPDSVAFLLSVMPGLRLAVGLSVLAGLVLLVLLWKFDRFRINRAVSAITGALALGGIVGLSNAVPE